MIIFDVSMFLFYTVVLTIDVFIRSLQKKLEVRAIKH
jgi:hypothetical protein